MSTRRVEVKVSVYVEVPKSRKRDKILAAMEMEGAAQAQVKRALETPGGTELGEWEVTDAIVEEP